MGKEGGQVPKDHQVTSGWLAGGGWWGEGQRGQGFNAISVFVSLFISLVLYSFFGGS
jgi:hypothetical protein